MKDIIVYSKKTGVNQYLFEENSLHNCLRMFEVDEGFPVSGILQEHKQYAYALVSGTEIKLFES